MANVLLISCNVAREPYPVYPLGMTMVAQTVQAHGHRVRQWDLLQAGQSLERTMETVQSFQPEVIGLSLRNIDNCDSSDPMSYVGTSDAAVGRLRIADCGLRIWNSGGASNRQSPIVNRQSPDVRRGDWTLQDLVRRLHESPRAPIVLGGAGYSLFPEALLEQIGADYGIVGEGETAFCRLIDQLVSGTWPTQRILTGEPVLTGELIGAQGRRGHSRHSRDPELASFFLKEGGMLNLQTKRGCPYRCAYCTYPVLEGRVYRFRPPEAVVDEIQMLITRHGADYYAMADSVFNDGQGHYLAIAEELVRRGIQVPWMAFFRPQHFDREEVDLLKRAGLHAVEWGADCACDTTLEQMKKGFTWDEVDRSNRLFAQAGIANANFLIFGGPGETEQTVREGLANIERLPDCVVFVFCGVRILPGTAVHAKAVEEGVVTADQDLLQTRFYFSPGVSRQFLHESLLRSFNNRRDRLYPPGKGMERIRVFHRMGYRGPIWDLLLGK